MKDPHNILNKELSATDGGNYGIRVLSYNSKTADYTVQNIGWSTGELLERGTHKIDRFKVTYRYQISKARPIKEETKNND